MSSTQVAKIDGKGRLIVPAAFREVLNIGVNSRVLLSLNTEKNRLMLLPFASAGDDLHRMSVALSDSPGSLSRLLSIMARAGVDIVQSESVASDRGRSAAWKATVDLSKCKLPPGQIKEMLFKEKVASSIDIARLEE